MDRLNKDKAAKSGSSFYYAFLFLPPPRRAAITAFYAFCREVDDVVDEVSDASVASIKLAWWRKEVASSFAGQPSHPAMKALMPHVGDYGIELPHLMAIIDGCQMDLEQTRFLDFDRSPTVLPHLQDQTRGALGAEEAVAPQKLSALAQLGQHVGVYGLGMQRFLVRDLGVAEPRARTHLGVPVNLQQDLVPALGAEHHAIVGERDVRGALVGLCEPYGGE